MKSTVKSSIGKRAVSFLLLAVMAMSFLPQSVFSTMGAETVTLVDDYASLSTVLTDAVAGDRIVVTADVTVPEGAVLSVPKGVRLVIAYNADGEYGGHTAGDYDSTTEYYTTDFTGKDPVYTFTVSSGAVLNVYGSLYVGGKLVSASGKEYQGATGTLYSKLVCNGTVNIQNGALYCYGYVDGEGSVNINGESSVYSPFVIGNFNGGSYIYGLYKVGGVSPLNDYIMPNIKSEMTIKYGSSVYGLCALYSGGAVNVSTPKLVGVSEALIVLENANSYIVSKYKENQSAEPTLTGKLELDFYGDIKAASLYMEIYYTPISTAEVIFPIPYGFDINVKQGTLTAENRFALLPGACLTVEKEGTLEIPEGGALYFLEGMNDTPSVNYCYPVGNEMLSNGYSNTACFTVNGTLLVKDGGIFAGTIKKVGTSAVVSFEQGAILSGTYTAGVSALFNINFTDYSYYNKTAYKLFAKALSVNGTLFNLEAGKTYYSADPNASYEVGSFDYTYYGTKAGDKPVNKTIENKYDVEGSLNTFAVVYNYADGSKKESVSTIISANTAGHVWYDMYTGEVITSIVENRFYMLGESNRYVTFKNGDEEVTLVIGADGLIPNAGFTKEHYDLSGWSKTEGGAKNYGISAKADFNTAVLYPVWTPKKYNVVYLLTPENYELYKGSYLYVDENGNYAIKEEIVEYNTSANAPGDDLMARDQLYFEWNGNLDAVSGDMKVFGEYFEYGVRNMRTGVVHTSLASAIENALNGDVLRIQQNTEESVEIPVGTELTIDLNGMELYYTGGSVITNNGKLTLVDNKKDGAIVQCGKGVSSSDIYYAVTNNGGATLTIDGASLVSDIDGTYTRTLFNKGTVIFNDGKISSNAGYAVYNYKNNSEAIFIQNGGSIEYSGTSSSSYGVYNYNKATYTLNGGSIEAVNGGRAFYNWLNSTLTVNGGVISSTTGGALFNNGAEANIYGGKITTSSLATLTYVISNTKYSQIVSTLNIYGGVISAPRGCRGINNQKSIVNMYGGTVETTGNTNYSWGIYNNDTATLNIYGGKVFAKSSHAIYNYSTSKATAPAVNVYGGHIVSTGAAGYYAVATGNSSKYGNVTISGGSFASNNEYAVYTDSANAVVTVTEGALGGLYKYTSAPINRYTVANGVSFTMKALSADGTYKGYYCMTSANKANEASVDGVKYQYISQALAEAKKGQIVTLLSDVKINSIAYPEGIIDLNGKIFDLAYNCLEGEVIYLKDSVGGGKLKGSDESTLLYTGEVSFVPVEKTGDIFLGYSADGSTWYITVPANKGELVIYPVYASNSKFTVVFKDEQGNVLSENVYSYGDKVSVPTAPVKEGDHVYNYVFAGWGVELEELCYSNREYVAAYSAEYVKYTVTFYDYYGNSLAVNVLNYGATVPAPPSILLPYDENNSYSFIGWTDGINVYENTDDIPTVTEDADYTASYKVTPYINANSQSVKFYSASVVFESSLTINFIAKAADLQGYDTVFVVFEREYADGRKVTTTEWDYKINGNYYVFKYNNIAAKEMGDTVKATLYAVKDGVKYSNNTVGYSILKYATNLLGKSTTNPKFKTVLVDMLNYGSAAQKYFNYNASNLVNAGLTEEQKALASWNGTDIELNTVKSYERLENEKAKFNSISLLFEDVITIKYILDLSSYTDDMSELSFVIRYKDSLGYDREKVVPFSEFVNNGNFYTVSFTDIPVKDMSIEVKATIYKNYGDMDSTQVSGTTTYSIESYAYSKATSTNKNLAYLVKSMIAFGNSTKAYLVD